jgi:imidazolonepropionase-like amidohydrolase
LKKHLAAYLACGVTTILDPAVLPEEQQKIEGLLASGAAGPRYLSLGIPFSPPGGYVAAVIPAFPSVDTPEAVEAQFNRVVQQGAVGVKVTMERGFLRPVWPLHSPNVQAAIRAGAEKRKLPIYVHAMSAEEQEMALALGAHATVHPLERYDRDLVQKLAEAGVFEMTTLSVIDAMRMPYYLDRLNNPLYSLLVPPIELETALAQGLAFEEFMIATMMPKLPFKKLAARSSIPNRQLATKLKHTGESLRAMRDAGVPIVMGSDAGNWPRIPYLFHGPSSLRELELLEEVGFTPEEVLTAATKTAGEMLQLEPGTVRVGGKADLVVVEGNPLEDLGAMREIRWTVFGGEARSPEEWLTAKDR